jgi:hypothetical protein
MQIQVWVLGKAFELAFGVGLESFIHGFPIRC